MCNIRAIAGWLIAAEVATLLAVSFISYAVFASGTIFLIFLAKGALMLAAFSFAATLGAVGVALALASASPCASGACATQGTGLRNFLIALMAALVVVEVLLVLAMQTQSNTIITALAVAIAGVGLLWVAAGERLNALDTCLRAPTVPQAPVVTIAWTGAYFTGIATVASVIVWAIFTAAAASG